MINHASKHIYFQKYSGTPNNFILSTNYLYLQAIFLRMLKSFLFSFFIMTRHMNPRVLAVIMICLFLAEA